MPSDTLPPFSLGHGSVHITTKRGRLVEIRNIKAEDDLLLVDLFHQLSEQTRRLRFFSPLPDLPDTIIWREAKRLADINPLQEAALLAIVKEDQRTRAVGVSRLVRDPIHHTTAELAIVIRDDFQGEGLGTVLLDLLLQVAMVRGLKQLRALSLAENEAVIRLFRKSGLPFESQTRRGETTTIISLV